jgi:hypothetical protein
MTQPIIWTQAQIDQLTALAQQAIEAGTNASWAPVYEYVYQQITEATSGGPIAEVDPSAWAWIGGARYINDANTPQGVLIRTYTSIQYKLRYGEDLSSGDLTAASNKNRGQSRFSAAGPLA